MQEDTIIKTGFLVWVVTRGVIILEVFSSQNKARAYRRTFDDMYNIFIRSFWLK